MLNQFTLVGRVKEIPVIKTTSQGNTVASLVVECDRSFRNSDGTLQKDVFNITLWKGIAQTCADCCKLNDPIAINGRMQDIVYQKDEHYYHNVELIAEKVSFIN